jgi:hypothetical protein
MNKPLIYLFIWVCFLIISIIKYINIMKSSFSFFDFTSMSIIIVIIKRTASKIKTKTKKHNSIKVK